MTQPNDPVYPHPSGYGNPDLTKREHFAAMAMQGLLANNYIIEQYKPEYIAEVAIHQADFLIEALNKEEQ